MKQSIKIGAVAVAALSMVSLSMAATVTWNGSTDADWTNPLNWNGGLLPALSGGLLTGDTIVIQNGTHQPTTLVPDFACGAATSPKFVLEAGAQLDVAMAAGGWSGVTGSDGTYADLAAGSSLTWSRTGYMQLSRNANQDSVYNVTDATFHFAASRVDLAFSEGRLSTFNLDGGTVLFDGQLWGAGNAGGEFGGGAHSLINLTDSSTVVAAGALVNSLDGAGGDATAVFDIQDVGSSMTFNTGGIFLNATAAEAQFGNVFTSSTLGTANLRANQVGTKITVSVIPEPATLGLVAAFGGGILFIRRRFMI